MYQMQNDCSSRYIPEMVTARSVELGSVSPETCIDTPVDCG